MGILDEKIQFVILLFQVLTFAFFTAFAVKLRNRFRFQDQQFRVLRQKLQTFSQSQDLRREEATTEIQNAICLTALGFRFPIFFDDFSIDTFHARVLVQYLLTWSPKTILELGSGTSTILTARAMQIVCGTEYEHIAVDHDESFLQQTKKLAKLNGLEDRITFLHCPLKTIESMGVAWYAELPAELGSRKIDLLIVDGPPAYKEEISNSRYPALPNLYSHLSPQCLILLDDANRKGEKAAITRWKAEFPEFEVEEMSRGKGVAVLSRGF